MHPLYGSLPGLYVQCGLHAVLWSHIGTLISLIAAKVPQDVYSPVSSLLDDHCDPVFDGVGQAGFDARANAFY